MASNDLVGQHVAIVVLGDIGRSPRMQYHALSVLSKGGRLSIVGYHGEDLVPSLNAQKDKIDLVLFNPFEWPKMKKLCWPLFAVIKAIMLVIQLFYALCRMKRPHCIIVQNPPAIPTLPVVCLYAALRGVNVIIDWHNLGFTMTAMALHLNPEDKHSLKYKAIHIFRSIERKCAQWAHGHYCVTHAMRGFLKRDFHIDATPLHDCPPSFFAHSLDIQTRHDLFQRLHKEFAPAEVLSRKEKGSTLFTRVSSTGEVSLREDRPALLISPTSWTEDEDFSILLNSLEQVDKADGVAAMVVVVTGKGPLRDFYIAKIKGLGLKRICVLTMWLSPSDYPLLLGCADLGICLHTSTSGLDLPMKVVDMFGSGVPVCAIHFKCIAELVKHNENGLVFSDQTELTLQLTRLFRHFPSTELTVLKKGVKSTVRWDENWTNTALPLLSHVLSKERIPDALLFILLSCCACFWGWVYAKYI